MRRYFLALALFLVLAVTPLSTYAATGPGNMDVYGSTAALTWGQHWQVRVDGAGFVPETDTSTYYDGVMAGQIGNQSWPWTEWGLYLNYQGMSQFFYTRAAGYFSCQPGYVNWFWDGSVYNGCISTLGEFGVTIDEPVMIQSDFYTAPYNEWGMFVQDPFQLVWHPIAYLAFNNNAFGQEYAGMDEVWSGTTNPFYVVTWEFNHPQGFIGPNTWTDWAVGISSASSNMNCPSKYAFYQMPDQRNWYVSFVTNHLAFGECSVNPFWPR